MDQQSELLFEELILSDARGGRKGVTPITIEIDRALVPQDLAALEAGDTPAKPQGGISLTSIRHSHHQIAKLLVSATELAEISLLTGYSPAWISTLKTDPAFKELLAYYEQQKELQFIDVLDRMKNFGLSVLDELQRRFDEDPADFKKSELFSMSDLFLLRSRAMPGGGASGGPTPAPLALNISFVTPAAPAPQEFRGPSIEGELSK